MSSKPSLVNPRHGSSQRQIRALLWIGFGGLLLLMCLLGASSISFLYQIEIRHERMRREYIERDRMLEKLRSNIYLSGTYFRDFILDPDPSRAPLRKTRFLEKRSEIDVEVREFAKIARPPEQPVFHQLERELTAYFDTLIPAISWNAEERRNRGGTIVQQQMLPRRTTAIGLADRVQQVSETQLEVSSEAVSEMFASFRARLLTLIVLMLIIGITLASITMWRLLRLERASETGFQEALAAREELQQLYAELRTAQEDERRRISRELHDEVGQVLSAMMLEIGNLRSTLGDSSTERHREAVFRQLQLIEDMTERNARVVRNISLLLRPTMLDDLGLIAALKWLAREVSRTSTLHVEVHVVEPTGDDAPDQLPEEHRTCVYRVVQEAVRNASRHSGARHVRITVETRDRLLHVSVQDDGKGFDPALEKGMGILGMEERVSRLGGRFRVHSGQGRGTSVSFELPLPDSLAAPAPLQEIKPLRTA